MLSSHGIKGDRIFNNSAVHRILAISGRFEFKYYHRCWDCIKCIQVLAEWIGEISKCCNSPWRFLLYKTELSGDLLVQKQKLHSEMNFFCFTDCLFSNVVLECSSYESFLINQKQCVMVGPENAATIFHTRCLVKPHIKKWTSSTM